MRPVGAQEPAGCRRASRFSLRQMCEKFSLISRTAVPSPLAPCPEFRTRRAAWVGRERPPCARPRARPERLPEFRKRPVRATGRRRRRLRAALRGVPSVHRADLGAARGFPVVVATVVFVAVPRSGTSADFGVTIGSTNRWGIGSTGPREPIRGVLAGVVPQTVPWRRPARPRSRARRTGTGVPGPRTNGRPGRYSFSYDRPNSSGGSERKTRRATPRRVPHRGCLLVGAWRVRKTRRPLAGWRPRVGLTYPDNFQPV